MRTTGGLSRSRLARAQDPKMARLSGGRGTGLVELMVVVGAIVILWFRDCDTICPWLWASDYDGSRRSRRAVGSFLLAEDFGPFAESRTGGDDSRAPLITLSQQVKEQLATTRSNGTKPSSSTINSAATEPDHRGLR